MYTCDNHLLCSKDAINKAEMICKDKGLRFTSLRKEVLEIIWSSHIPAKAYDILNKLKSYNEPAKPPTVYRTLDFLIENGLVHKLNTINAYIGCSHPLKHNECYFLICQSCEEVIECCNGNLSQAISKTADNNKFNAKNITIEVTGKCEECIKKLNKKHYRHDAK